MYFKEVSLKHRYINLKMLQPLLDGLPTSFRVHKIGKSVQLRDISGIQIGTGLKKILMWSQMHGNESTTTKAVFDLLKLLQEDIEESRAILNNCTLYIIPMLNPDGAEAYTRVNANMVDLNRDSQELSQPESMVLRKVFEEFKPDFCFNLHGQRTIFGAGDNGKSATVSFLTPSEDVERTVTHQRKRSMEIIAVMNEMLQQAIPDGVGRYDDSFNLNCVGDTFQYLGVPTILFEAGHHINDYEREITREFIHNAMFLGLSYIASKEVTGEGFQNYFEIPENKKNFLDVILHQIEGKNIKTSMGIQFKEVLVNNKITFEPICVKIGNLTNKKGHFERDINIENGEKSLFQSFAIGDNVSSVLKNIEYFNSMLINL